MKIERIVIVGGVAGGASCAARARRLSEEAEIVVFERGSYVSFANCGLPYYVGNVIKNEEDLLVASPALFRERFNIDIRILSNVLSIFPEKKTIEIENLQNGKKYQEHYDALVLAPGSEPLRPNLPGIDLPGIFTPWTIPDTRKIIRWIKNRKTKNAVVVGGGFIGLEMTENLKRLGIDVTVVEMCEQVMPLMDPEIGVIIEYHLRKRGVNLCLGSPVCCFRRETSAMLKVVLTSGQEISADLVILSIGVRPRTELARAAGLKIGECGAIWVDEQMRTSHKHIYAVGDAVEVKDFITGQRTIAPFAGPANRQGRLVADVILKQDSCKRQFRGVQSTMVCGILGLTIASSGKTEKQLKQNSDDYAIGTYEKIYLEAGHHAGYYPDAEPIILKLIYRTQDGRLLGAQAVGKEGVEKRIDVISMAIQKNGTVYDLEEAELCYAPQYGSAKDLVNIAGMVAANSLRGHVNVYHWEHLFEANPYILDVRESEEYAEGHASASVNIPLNSLRNRIGELPLNRKIWVYCYMGLRSYIASRILLQNGFRVGIISGGFMLYTYLKRFNPHIV